MPDLPTRDATAAQAQLVPDLGRRRSAGVHAGDTGADGGVGEQHALAVQRMFDRISPTYDLLNRWLSAGTDRRWRRRALELLAEDLPEGPLLDSCAGTLDLAAAMLQRFGERQVVAADFAREMLLAGRGKLGGRGQLAVADAMALPFASGSFAGMTCGFGMRNLARPERGIAECHRVLKAGGRLVVLEFFRPTAIPSRLFHALYGRVVLPLLGGLVSGDGEAYGYLSRSMRGFMTRGEFARALEQAGFREVGSCDLTFGIASLVWGRK